MKKILLPFVYVLLSASISTMADAKGIDHDAIEMGKTTKNDIKAKYGEPKKIEKTDDMENWIYCEDKDGNVGVTHIEFDKNRLAGSHSYSAIKLFGSWIGGSTAKDPSAILCGIK